MKTTINLFIMLISSVVWAQEFSVLSKKIDDIIASQLDEEDPGIAVGIIKDGDIVYEAYRGLSNLQHQVKFNEKTRSNIASTAKQFTALMVLDLSMKGKFSLDDDIRQYLPELYKEVKSPLLIRQIINHTSGIRDYVELMGLEGQVWWQRFKLDNNNVMDYLYKQNSLGFTPGSQYSYSNSNYIVLAKLIEQFTEENFNAYSKNFFQNLGMKETYFIEKYMAVIPNKANPYSDWGRGEWWEVPTVTKTNGEGFLYTTLKDQLRYETLVQNAQKDHNQLIIQSQKVIPNSEITSYGFGLELSDRFGRKSVHHSGGTYGYHSQTYRFPNDGLTIFIMSNHGNISSNLIAQEIAKILLPKIENEQPYETSFYQTKKDETIQISELVGQYDFPDSDNLVRIVEKDQKLYWRVGNYLNLEMLPDGVNTYKFTYNPKLKVVFSDVNMIEYYPSGRTMVYNKNKDKPATKADEQAYIGVYYNSELDLSFELMLDDEQKLKMKLSSKKRLNDVQIFNRNFLLASDSYILKIQRDEDDQINSILFTYDRAQKMRFKKLINKE